MLRTEVVRHSLIRKAGGEVVPPTHDRIMTQIEIDSFRSLKKEKEVGALVVVWNHDCLVAQACMALQAVYAKQPLLKARVRHLMDCWKVNIAVRQPFSSHSTYHI